MKGDLMDLETKSVTWLKKNFEGFSYYKIPIEQRKETWIEETYARIVLGSTLNTIMTDKFTDAMFELGIQDKLTIANENPFLLPTPTEFHDNSLYFGITLKYLLKNDYVVLAHPLDCLLFVVDFELPQHINRLDFLTIDPKTGLKGFSASQVYSKLDYVQKEVYSYSLENKIGEHDECFITEKAELQYNDMEIDCGLPCISLSDVKAAVKGKKLFAVKCESHASIYYVIATEDESRMLTGGEIKLAWSTGASFSKRNVSYPLLVSMEKSELLTPVCSETASGLMDKYL